MTQLRSKFVMDVCPWPQGQGFTGRQAWWNYVLTLDQQDRLDVLLMMALLSEQIRHSLLRHDRILLSSFEFSPDTMTLLEAIEAETLEEFAQALILKK